MFEIPVAAGRLILNLIGAAEDENGAGDAGGRVTERRQLLDQHESRDRGARLDSSPLFR